MTKKCNVFIESEHSSESHLGQALLDNNGSTDPTSNSPGSQGRESEEELRLLYKLSARDQQLEMYNGERKGSFARNWLNKIRIYEDTWSEDRILRQIKVLLNGTAGR